MTDAACERLVREYARRWNVPLETARRVMSDLAVLGVPPDAAQRPLERLWRDIVPADRAW
jgi:hypothetical protein